MGQLKDNFSDLDFGYFYITRLSLLMSLISFLVAVVVFIDDLCSTKLLTMNVAQRNLYINS